MRFLHAHFYVHYVIFLSMVMRMHIKLMNTSGNWLIGSELFENFWILPGGIKWLWGSLGQTRS